MSIRVRLPALLRVAAWLCAVVVTCANEAVVPAHSRQRQPAPQIYQAQRHKAPEWQSPPATEPSKPGDVPRRVPLPPKQGTKRRPVDIGLGHRVKRGPDWEWDDQDGGKGGVGTVIEIAPWRGETDPYKFGVRVKWERTGHVNLYRWGVHDKFDLDVIGYSDKEAARAMRVPPQEDPPTFVLDKEALREIFRSADGQRWAYKKGWTDDESDPCKDAWSGVTCNATTGRVIALDLANNRVSSRFPRGVEKLLKLQALTLGYNKIEGTIPLAIGRLTELRWLDLHDNRLSGTLPATLGALRQLEWLSVYNNRLEGSLPTQLGNAQNLGHLFMQANMFSGTIPAEWCNLAKLQSLNLDNNAGLFGALPQCLSDLPSLTKLTFPRSVLPQHLFEKLRKK